MYHFLGYVIKNAEGVVVNFSPTREQATVFCGQNGLLPGGITQVYEWKMQPVIEVPDEELPPLFEADTLEP